MKPLEPLDLEGGEEVIVVLKEDLVVFAQRIHKNIEIIQEAKRVPL